MRDGWTTTTLGEIAHIRIGRTPPRKDARYWTDDLTRPFCTIADMDDALVTPRREGVTELAEREGKAKRVPAGSLLMSFKLTIGRVGMTAVDVFPNEAIAWLEPSTTAVDRRFLGLWLGATDVAADAGRAVKGNTLNGNSLRAIAVSFPPLAEQRRIVDLISRVEDALESAARVERRASGAWVAWACDCWAGADDEVRIGDLGHAVTGATPRSGIPAYWEPAEVPFFTPGDFDGSPVLTESERRVSRRGAETVRMMSAPAVAQVCIGATYGKVAVLGTPGCTNQQVNALIGLDDIDAVAAMAMLASKAGQERLRSVAGITTMPIVKKSSWESMYIRWPSRPVRTNLHAMVMALADLASCARRERSALETLRHDLLSELLSGRHEIPATYDRFLDGAA